ncbi:histidinol-phosphatase [Glycomyces buryatensis]|uniref:Histidinol-phosphatase n=1 Tax=Glycomyces buryatensis TaxID=2570927 RepID=A0A4S8QRJ4_9ACTN|nr:histidinol-phosphatase [Glycomyces buryatensis]THV43274.1 histidinol-phosphatase [Glycomyces buryatensis]
MSSSYNDDLGLAHLLADSAAQIGNARFRSSDLRVSTKPDMTEVSDADTTIEEVLRSTLSRARPRDGVYGEEFGDNPGASGRKWVIDPIDATRNYVRGVPVWATLIALFERGEPVVGVVSAPALNRRWWAMKGAGAWAGRDQRGGKKIQVSRVSKLADASVSYSSITNWNKVDRQGAMLGLLHEVWRERGFGDFYSYCLLAEGCVDIVAEPEVALWDLAPLALIVEEAGGTFTDLKGRPGPDGGTAVATNGLLHEPVLDRIGIR